MHRQGREKGSVQTKRGWGGKTRFKHQAFHCPGSAFTNRGTAASANSRKTALCRNLIQWCTITHTVFGSTAREPCDSAAAARVFLSPLLCREVCKAGRFVTNSMCCVCHLLKRPAAGASTRAVSFLKVFTFSCLLSFLRVDVWPCWIQLFKQNFGIHF